MERLINMWHNNFKYVLALYPTAIISCPTAFRNVDYTWKSQTEAAKNWNFRTPQTSSHSIVLMNPTISSCGWIVYTRVSYKNFNKLHNFDCSRQSRHRLYTNNTNRKNGFSGRFHWDDFAFVSMSQPYTYDSTPVITFLS